MLRSQLCLRLRSPRRLCAFFFFFNDTATTEIYTLSLHDALPICCHRPPRRPCGSRAPWQRPARSEEHTSELQSRFGISYAVFCLKKKNKRRNKADLPRGEWGALSGAGATTK